MECDDFNHVRNKHFVAFSIKNLFDNIDTQNIIDFIKETLFYISNFNVYILMFVCYLLFILAQ